MTVAGKYVLLAVLTVGTLVYLHAGMRAAAVNLHRLRSWKRIPGTVYAFSSPTIVQVRVGSGSEETILKIPRTYDAGYWADSTVTVIENPENPEERRLTGFFDLWNRALVAAVFGLALMIATWLVWNTTWGIHAAWSDGDWRPAAVALYDPVPDLEVHEPGESWKANLFWGCVFGLSMGLPPFFVTGEWRPWHAMVVALSAGFLSWMLQSAVLNYSRTVRLSVGDLEERTLFGSRRIPFDELGGLEFHDAGQELENLKPWQARRMASVWHIRVWRVKDREGRDVFSLPEGMTPADTFRAMRERIGRRAPAR